MRVEQPPGGRRSDVLTPVGQWLVDPESGNRVYVYHPLHHGDFLGWVVLAFSGPLVMLGAALAWVLPRYIVLLLVVLGLFSMVTCAIWAAKLQEATQAAPAHGALDHEPKRPRFLPAPGYDIPPWPPAKTCSELNEPPPALGP